jgi:hypothetical protein
MHWPHIYCYKPFCIMNYFHVDSTPSMCVLLILHVALGYQFDQQNMRYTLQKKSI